MEPGRDAGVPGLGRRDDGRRRSVLLRHRPPAVRPRPQPGPRGPRSPKARVTRPVTAQGRRITLPLDFAFPGSAARGRERRRAPAERSQVDGEQIVDVRTEEFRVGLRERLAVRRSGKLTVTPRPKERGQLRIQQERRDPFPPIIDAAPRGFGSLGSERSSSTRARTQSRRSCPDGAASGCARSASGRHGSRSNSRR